MGHHFPGVQDVYSGVSFHIRPWVFAGEDYSIASSDVVLLEGETTKAVPIYIINDIYPELEETFLVQLLNETTGGATLGPLREAVITIEASDDPYGLFGN
jgi:G-protein coupled receptor 98